MHDLIIHGSFHRSRGIPRHLSPDSWRQSNDIQLVQMTRPRIRIIIKHARRSRLIHIIRKERYRASTPVWANLIQVQMNRPCRSKSFTCPSWRKGSSRKLKWCDKSITKSDVTRLPFLPCPSSLPRLPPSDEKEEQYCNPPEQVFRGQRTLEKVSQIL